MYNRKQYMNNEVTHDQYFTAMAEHCGIGNFNPTLIARVKRALANGDQHLNTIPLAQWDQMAAYLSPRVKRGIAECDGFYTLAGAVCMLKAAARKQATTPTNQE